MLIINYRFKACGLYLSKVAKHILCIYISKMKFQINSKRNSLHTGKLCNASGTTIINRSLALSVIGDELSSPFCPTDARRLI